MYDKSLIIEILIQILHASRTVEQRFKIVDSMDYFMDTPEGQEKLDSICMQLIAIKKILKDLK